MQQKDKPKQKITKSSVMGQKNTVNPSSNAEIYMKNAEDLASRLRPSIIQKQLRSRIGRPDTPLAPTPAPTAIDNTFVKKPIIKNN